MRNNKNNISFNIKNITLCLLILILSSINIINTFTYIPNASALSYQSSTNIGFTFNPTISVSISPNNLIIPNLTPGTAADSNPITVSVSTNTAYGYHLTVNVGSNIDNYNTTNLVHTTFATSVPEPPLLYDAVQDMTKGTLAENNVKLSDTITQANSGVYTYDSAVYGVASDASNDYPIYFYRGILDTDAGLGTYGSDGQADAWPNYAKLNNDTCWRIVRTTGSGGVKMIYNGMYGATTAGSCANAGGKAKASSQPFGLKGNSSKTDWYKNINRVGYTFNNNLDIQDITDSVPVDVVFGNNSNYAETNTTNSNVKNYLENTWFASNMGDYESRLESSAGYCNDRSIYSDAATKIELSEISPYATSGTAYFGAYGRNSSTTSSKNPSFSCPRGVVDLYSVNGSTTGNGQLSRPIAIITADEVSFSGNGGKTARSAHSYLYSAGEHLLLLSPYDRNNGIANISLLYDTGSLYRMSVYNGNLVRPAVSLVHYIQVTSGSGTATSPWTIEQGIGKRSGFVLVPTIL